MTDNQRHEIRERLRSVLWKAKTPSGWAIVSAMFQVDILLDELDAHGFLPTEIEHAVVGPINDDPNLSAREYRYVGPWKRDGLVRVEGTTKDTEGGTERH